jgi:gamma-glutamyltranspeptidase/glutathione hydrolase
LGRLRGAVLHGATSALLALALTAPADARSHPPLRSKAGVVAADNADAARVGAEVLAAGGNAADAAAATALALGVVHPGSSGIGGGGFALVYVARDRRVYAFDFREVAPAALTPAHFEAQGALDPARAQVGGLAVAVPGEVAGLEELVRRFGRRPFRKAVEPAARLAKTGFAASRFLAEQAADELAGAQEDPWFARWLTRVREGERIARPELARALGAIAKQGSRAFYRGWIAKDIVDAVTSRGGVMTLDDLAAYRVIEREPLWGQWRGLRVAAMPLPSSGGLVVLASLGLLDATGEDLAALGAGSSASLHLLAEAFKHAFADRARLLADPDYATVSAERFLAAARLAALARRIRKLTVGEHDDYGDASVGDAAPARDDGGTSHLCVIDADGNAVALTTTINLEFGAGVIAPASGVVLNDEVDDFTLRAGVPNAFGLVQSEANLVGGGKRPLSSMSPTLVFDGDRVVGCVGGSGGPRIITGVVQVLLNVFVHGMDARAAVEAPRIHHQWLPDALGLEREIPRDVEALLGARGHATGPLRNSSAVQLIVVRDDGTREAAGDPRKHGAPAAEDAR